MTYCRLVNGTIFVLLTVACHVNCKNTRAAGRLKILIAINLAIKKNLILVNLEFDHKNNVYQLATTARHFAEEKNNHISNGLCSYALVYSYYRSSQSFRHTSLLTLAGERAARVLLTVHLRLKINRD